MPNFSEINSFFFEFSFPCSQKLTKPKKVVMKFGGSSLSNAERIDHVTQLIKDQMELGYQPRAVVCSAMGKTTNSLLSAGDFALGKCVFF